MNFEHLPLIPESNYTTTFTMGSVDAPYVVEITPTYNYTTQLWSIDLRDSSQNDLVCGIALVPGFDLMLRFPNIQKLIGSLVIVELNAGDYMDPDLLGSNVLLLWYPVGTEVEIPV
jgi:hypothetical protein